MNKKRIVYTLSGVIVMAMSSTDIFLSSLPQMAIDFKVEPDIVNLMLTVNALGMALGCLGCGFISDRYGRKLLFINALLGYMLVSLAIALVPDIVTIIILRFIQGLFMSVFAIVSRQIITDISNDKKDQLYYTGILVAGIVLSPAIAPIVGAYIAHFLSWRWCFVLCAILAAIFYRILRANLLESNQKPVALPRINELYEEYATFFRSRTFNVYSAMITFTYGTYFAFITISSFIYIEHLKVSPTTYSTVFLGLAGAFLSGNYLMLKLNKKNVSPPHIVASGLAISLLGIIISSGVYLTQDIDALLIMLTLGAVFIRCGCAMIMTTSKVIVMNAENWRPGTALGLLYFLQFVFGAASSAVVSSMHSSPIYGMVAVIIVLTVSSLLIFQYQCYKGPEG